MAAGGSTAGASILRSRPIAALLTAEVLSTTGSQMTWLALPWFVLVTSGSKQMAFVVAAEAAGYALFGIPSGSLLQRLGPQRTIDPSRSCQTRLFGVNFDDPKDLVPLAVLILRDYGMQGGRAVYERCLRLYNFTSAP